MNASLWTENHKIIQKYRLSLKEQFGFHVSEELHTKNLLTDKEPYRKYAWTAEEKREIIRTVVSCLRELKIKIGNVIVDKTRITDCEYRVLESALEKSVQILEDDCQGEWQYLMITDKGRIAPMRKIVRAMREDNGSPLHMVEDMLEKESDESYFIQMCDFVSCFVHLYYKTKDKKEDLPNRVEKVIDVDFVEWVMGELKTGGILNLSTGKNDPYGLIIIPE